MNGKRVITLINSEGYLTDNSKAGDLIAFYMCFNVLHIN